MRHAPDAVFLNRGTTAAQTVPAHADKPPPQHPASWPGKIVRHLLLLTGATVSGCTAVKVNHIPDTRVEFRRPPDQYVSSRDYVQRQDPPYLNYEELLSLIHNPKPEGELQNKLDQLWHTPIISNEAYYSGPAPRMAGNSCLGPFIRVATWNIEKSLMVPRAVEAVTSAAAYEKQIDPVKAPPRNWPGHST